MKKAMVATWITGVVIAITFGLIKYGTAEISLLTGVETSNAIFIPPVVAGFVAGLVSMAGTRSKIKGFGHAIAAVFAGSVVGHYIGYHLLLSESEKALTRLGDVPFTASIFVLVIALIPMAIGLFIGGKVFKSEETSSESD